MTPKKRDRSWPPADAVEPLAAPVTDNHTHLPVPADTGGPGSGAPLSWSGAPPPSASPAW